AEALALHQPRADDARQQQQADRVDHADDRADLDDDGKLDERHHEVHQNEQAEHPANRTDRSEVASGAMATEAPRRWGFDWRGRLLPRPILGITALLLAAPIGAAFSGTIFYAFYPYRLATNNTTLGKKLTLSYTHLQT